jgi:Flp pilus assembly pilin Flp
VHAPAEPARRPASREGIAEYLIVFAFVALAIAGALALFGDDIRGALGTATAAARPSR